MLMQLSRIVQKNQSVRLRTSCSVLGYSDTRRQDKPNGQRCYHATPKQEILPLLGAATVVLIGRYSYKAMKRMDEEWEDYQWELQQYEKQMARTNPDADAAKAVAIDLGSVYTKLAVSHPQPEIIVSREGDRSFFNGIIVDSDDTVIRGRAALEKYFYEDETSTERNPVELPWEVLAKEAFSNDDNASNVIRNSLSPALQEALERLQYSTSNGKPVRQIVTVPVKYAFSSDGFQKAFGAMTTGQKPIFIPEPVAAIWGAQTKYVLPEDDEKAKSRAMLVVDVGGWTTQISAVQKDVVQYSFSVPWGGETFVQTAAGLLKKDSSGPLNDARSLSALQTQARAAVAELTSKTRTSIHIPYLFADPKNHHLDTELSRAVLEQALNSSIGAKLVPQLQGKDILSPHMPNPTNISSLFTSVITQVLEYSKVLPKNIDHVLLVGGGAKAPVIRDSLSETLFMLMGSDGSKKLAIPESALLTELTVLGAATMLPSYEYSIFDGLKRVN